MSYYFKKTVKYKDKYKSLQTPLSEIVTYTYWGLPVWFFPYSKSFISMVSQGQERGWQRDVTEKFPVLCL